MNNAAVICKIKNVRPHFNANKVQLGTACGYQVVVGLDVNEGDLGVYFPTDTCLGKDFAEANPDLLTYFGKNRRVKTQKFRGEKSEGFWVDTSALFKCNLSNGLVLETGTELTTFEGKDICYKYVNLATQAAKNRDQSKLKKVLRSGSLPTFQKHVETSHLRKEWERIAATMSDRQWIWTFKAHGTSARVTNCLVPKDISICTNAAKSLGSKFKVLTRKIKQKNLGDRIDGELVDCGQRIDSWLLKQYKKLPLTQSSYQYLIGTRNVILGGAKQDTWYPEEFRQKAAKPFIGNLHKGEVIYYEIVGYSAPGVPIMAKHTTGDKELKRLYGKEIIYTYGCKDGEFDIYVYRIAYQTEDGQSIDLTWDQVKTRCKELGVKHVVEADTGLSSRSPSNWVTRIQEFVDQPDPIDPRHPLEGVVLRVEGSKPEFFKEKSFTFKVLEGISIDKGAVDLEEAS